LTAVDEAWKRIGKYHHNGINLPLGALHSDQSTGIGDFYDLLPMIDWCSKIGFDVIQLLPLNDSGFDPSPYNSLSSIALNPVYISLEGLENSKLNLEHIKRLNKLQRVDYDLVVKEKSSLLYEYFLQEFESLSKEYLDFKKSHNWLEHYALFKVLKDKYDFRQWSSWPKELQTPSHTLIKRLIKEHSEKIAFYIFLQYLCFKQMKKVKNHASSKGVFLKGDIPILISPESADVWLERHLFNLDLAAGAPPDIFNEEGQYWGFPLFDWKTIEQSNYGWWVRRLHFAENFYDIYRIDHIIGFFRIWAIPRDLPALKGHFEPSEPWAYLEQGTNILRAMNKSSHLLPIGEDLGIIPNSVHKKLQELQISGTKVLRWEKDWDGDKEYIPLKDYKKYSLTTVSTHDSETLELWWHKYESQVKEFCEFHNLKKTDNLTYEVRLDILKLSHSTPSFFHINLLGEYLALYNELVSDDPKDERINVPGHILPTNWTYRFAASIEEITSHEKLCGNMRDLSGLNT